MDLGPRIAPDFFALMARRQDLAAFPPGEMGRVIKRLREEVLDLSQNEFARHWGVSASFLSKIESGDRKVSPAEIESLAKLVGTQGFYLVFLAHQTPISQGPLGKAVEEFKREIWASIQNAVKKVRDEAPDPSRGPDSEAKAGDLAQTFNYHRSALKRWLIDRFGPDPDIELALDRARDAFLKRGGPQDVEEGTWPRAQKAGRAALVALRSERFARFVAREGLGLSGRARAEDGATAAELLRQLADPGAMSPSRQPSLRELLARSGHEDALSLAIAALAPGRRRAAKLFHVDGLSNSEVADALNTSRSNVTQLLKQVWKEWGLFPPLLAALGAIAEGQRAPGAAKSEELAGRD